jgi:hypothetical protein
MSIRLGSGISPLLPYLFQPFFYFGSAVMVKKKTAAVRFFGAIRPTLIEGYYPKMSPYIPHPSGLAINFASAVFNL